MLSCSPLVNSDNDHMIGRYGRFHKWGYPNSWMIYKGNSHLEMDNFGYPYDLGNPHIEQTLTSQLSDNDLSKPWVELRDFTTCPKDGIQWWVPPGESTRS